MWLVGRVFQIWAGIKAHPIRSGSLTVIGVLFVTFVLPPLQEIVGDKIKSAIEHNGVAIGTCAPLSRATLLVKSRNGTREVIHSAQEMPLMQSVIVVVHNYTGHPLTDASVLIVPFNQTTPKLAHAEFSTNNLTLAPDLKVSRRDDGSFFLSLGTFMADQTLILDGIAMCSQLDFWWNLSVMKKVAVLSGTQQVVTSARFQNMYQ